MEFINCITCALFFVKGAGASKLRWIAVCALLAASAAGLAQFNRPRHLPAQAEQATALQREAAARRVKTDGSYASLAAALAAARYQINAAPGQSGAPFYASNPGQRLRATFASDEVRVNADEVRVNAASNKPDGKPDGAELR